MAKLVFNYGAMGSSKTANALMVAYNYQERNRQALILKPGTDTRDGITKIRSRSGLENNCVILEDFMQQYRSDPAVAKQYDALIVDEVQFASPEDIDLLSDIADFQDIPVLCYGLRCDFQNRFFPGASRLMEIADEINEIKTICWCGKKALCNARYGPEGIIKEGEQVVLGANHNYISLCRKHFKIGDLGPGFR